MIIQFLSRLYEGPRCPQTWRSNTGPLSSARPTCRRTRSDRDAAQAVAKGLRDAKAANTKRAYGSALHELHVWALESDRQSLPAVP